MERERSSTVDQALGSPFRIRRAAPPHIPTITRGWVVHAVGLFGERVVLAWASTLVGAVATVDRFLDARYASL